VITRLPAAEMVAGYCRVLETVYDPEIFFQRCRENLARWKRVRGLPRSVSIRDLACAWRAIRGQGLVGTYRRAYWQFLAWAARHHPDKLGRAIAMAAAGHHYITYTREVAVPGLVDHARDLALEAAPAPSRERQPGILAEYLIRGAEQTQGG
jgi:hypothetical protein